MEKASYLSSISEVVSIEVGSEFYLIRKGIKKIPIRVEGPYMVTQYRVDSEELFIGFHGPTMTGRPHRFMEPVSRFLEMAWIFLSSDTARSFIEKEQKKFPQCEVEETSVKYERYVVLLEEEERISEEMDSALSILGREIKDEIL